MGRSGLALVRSVSTGLEIAHRLLHAGTMLTGLAKEKQPTWNSFSTWFLSQSQVESFSMAPVGLMWGDSPKSSLL